MSETKQYAGAIAAPAIPTAMISRIFRRFNKLLDDVDDIEENNKQNLSYFHECAERSHDMQRQHQDKVAAIEQAYRRMVRVMKRRRHRFALRAFSETVDENNQELYRLQVKVKDNFKRAVQTAERACDM